MRIAFYAPLKPPDHPVPSGDRQLARALLEALAGGGHDVAVASRFRSFDARGDHARQQRLAALGARIAERLTTRLARAPAPELWFTYHLHHKAPDLLGPAVSGALRIPYVVAEASVAPRQRGGPWAAGHARALAAVRAADTIVFLNPLDAPQVRSVRAPDAPCEWLAPFIDVAAFAGDARHAPARGAGAGETRLATVAMMRDGAKLASYRTLAAALQRLRDLPWKLTIIGDGPARAEVVAAFAALAGRVRFLGARPATEVAALLRESDVFVWPAVDEAIGIVFIEAQACGVPVVGADAPGVAAVVDAGRTGLLVAPADAAAFADALRRLLLDPRMRERMRNAARAYVRERHDLPAAVSRLDAILRAAVARRRAIGHAPAVDAPC
ncbi:MAG TPA: glycosyltransferase family 4 protein [Casimicrobiaceae bacterium]